MKKVFLLLMLLGLFGSAHTIKAQNVLDGIYEKAHVTNHKPIPYPYIREADVMWAKKVWRIIDLRERINLSLYYPIQAMDDRYSLIELLIYGIQYEGLTAFSAKNNDEFKVPMSTDQVMQEMGAVNDTSDVLNVATGQYEPKIIIGVRRSDEVKQLMVKEIWYFDRNYSKLDVRILGICPIREYVESVDGADEIKRKQVFWIYFPQARDIFARHEVFNPKNDSQRRTFDDIFIKRYFGSYIVREANVYNNRQIDQYAQGMEAMLESDRIKNDISTFEHDLWEF